METKICKQCGRALQLDCFVKYPARGRGIYDTKQGHHTVCKECEQVDRIARWLLTHPEDTRLNTIKKHYETLKQRGLPPVTKAAAQLIGHVMLKEGKGRPKSLPKFVLDVQDENVLAHADKVRNRTYSSFEEADAAHRIYTDGLRAAGLYEEINNLMDEWFDEA